jgi:MATE family multidrug resistance protein
VGNHFREYSKCCFELFIYLWYLDIPELGLLAGIGTIASRFVMLGYMHYMMMQKRKSFSLFREVFSKTSKEASILQLFD